MGIETGFAILMGSIAAICSLPAIALYKLKKAQWSDPEFLKQLEPNWSDCGKKQIAERFQHGTSSKQTSGSRSNQASDLM